MLEIKSPILQNHRRGALRAARKKLGWAIGAGRTDGITYGVLRKHVSSELPADTDTVTGNRNNEQLLLATHTKYVMSYFRCYKLFTLDSALLHIQHE